MPVKHALLGLGVLFSAVATSVGYGAEIQRVPSTYPNSPILQSATLPAGTELTFVSGLLPDPIDPKASKEALRAGGDTEAQTVAVLRKLAAALKTSGLGLGDVVQLRVFLVGDAAHAGQMDFDGLQRGFRQFFATPEQPLKPTRTTVQVAGLVLPGALIEIEAVAAKAR